MTYRGRRNAAGRLGALGLALLLTSSCASNSPARRVDPDAEATASAFVEALRARDVARLQQFFAPTILVIDTSFAGRSVKGTAYSPEELVRWYAALFEKFDSSRWSAVMENRRSQLSPASHDGHHLPFTKAGDQHLELARPRSQKLELTLEFVFRRISGEYKLVGQSEVFE